jgi:hypothetical protein
MRRDCANGRIKHMFENRKRGASWKPRGLELCEHEQVGAARGGPVPATVRTEKD